MEAHLDRSFSKQWKNRWRQQRTDELTEVGTGKDTDEENVNGLGGLVQAFWSGEEVGDKKEGTNMQVALCPYNGGGIQEASHCSGGNRCRKKTHPPTLYSRGFVTAAGRQKRQLSELKEL
ncbi:hypothetical protein NDU88_005151 [Pleurodeles waltl]|uniref:Uncharacterized protein n=1 Tax=Pleurodeles waltl TaxID=8319 RepID=A0AAV7PI23_PLEWA|nr:hypothetical protein NDU88_005151 [Pleurodeles waltl]